MNELSIDAKASYLRKEGYWIGKNPRTDVVAMVYDLDHLKRTDPVTWNKYGRADRPMVQQSSNIFDTDSYKRDYTMFEVANNTSSKDVLNETVLSGSIHLARKIDNESLRRQSLEHLATLLVKEGKPEEKYRAIVLFKEALAAAKASGAEFAINFASKTMEVAKKSGLDEKSIAELNKYADFDKLSKIERKYYETHHSEGD